MAVRADHLALVDFVENRLPLLETEDERADVGHLVATDVIEVQHHWVRFTTINAGVLAEIVEQQSTKQVAESAGPTADALPAQLGVLGVYAFLGRDVARLAARLTTVPAPGLSVEVVQGLPHLACGAPLAGYGGLAEERHGSPMRQEPSRAGAPASRRYA